MYVSINILRLLILHAIKRIFLDRYDLIYRIGHRKQLQDDLGLLKRPLNQGLNFDHLQFNDLVCFHSQYLHCFADER